MVMSTGETITDAFLDWVKQTIAGTGLVADGCLFDEREKGLTWIISEAVQAFSDVVCVVSLPGLSHDEGTPMAGGYKVSLEVRLRRCPVLCNVNSLAITEKLFRVFDGAKFYPGATEGELADLNSNVTAEGIGNISKGDADLLHRITLSTVVQI